MKKFLLSALSVLAIGSTADAQQVAKTPFIEHFTQASCGPCASQNPTMYNTLDAFDTNNDYVKVTYQVSWPGTDPMNAAYPAGPNDRRTYYGVTGVPNATLNGGNPAGPNTVVTASTLNTAAALMTDWNIQVSHTANGNNFDLNVTVTNQGSAASTAGLILHTAMTEKEIKYATAPGSNGETEFFYVARNMYDINSGNPSTGGYTMPAVPAGGSVTFTKTLAAPGYVADVSQIGFALWIQDDASKEVLQSAYSAPYVPPTALDVSTANAVYPSGNYCTNANFSPSFEVTNATANVVTSVEAQYTVNGGTPVTATLSGVSLAQGQSGTVTFPAATLPGGANDIEYSIVTLNGSDPDYVGSNNTGLTGTVSVLNANAVPAPVVEDMESATLPAGDAFTRDIATAIFDAPGIAVNRFGILDGPAANVGNVGGFANSARGIYVNFYALQTGTMDLVFHKINLGSGSQLTFDHAYRQYQSENDKLDIDISTDCGATWTNVWSQAGATLATGAAQTGNFVPSVNTDWRANTVDLSTYDNTNDVVVRFRATSAYGNNLVIDNINVSVASNVTTVTEAATAVKVMPNPVRDNMTLEFTTADATDASISIVNALGQKVQEVANDTYNGTTAIQINTADLANGVYFLNIATKDGVTTERFTVSK